MEKLKSTKECKSCGEKNLSWNEDLNKVSKIWRLAEVFKLADGTVVYKTHDCPKFKKIQDIPKNMPLVDGSMGSCSVCKRPVYPEWPHCLHRM